MKARPSNLKVSSDERPNTIGLQPRHLDELLDDLDQPENAENIARRQFSRWPFRQATIRITLCHPGGSTVSLKLACRNLSRGGIGLLHTSFAHPGSSCWVELPTVGGRTDRIEGLVQRCSHRRGTLHELGIKFRQPIDLARYAPRDQTGWSPSLEHVVPDRLVGTVVYAEPSLGDLEAFQVAIKDTSLALRHVRTGAEVLEQRFEEVTVVVSDLKLADMSGVELLGKMRKAGVKVPVLLLSGQPLGATGSHLQDSCCALVQKPVPAQMLLRILAEWTLVTAGKSGENTRTSQPALAVAGSGTSQAPQGPVKTPPESAAA